LKPSIKFLNLRKVTKTLSNISFLEDETCPAHSLFQEGFTAYVPKVHYDQAIRALKYYNDMALQNKDSTASNLALQVLTDLGEI
jgi:hypothetical protein